MRNSKILFYSFLMLLVWGVIPKAEACTSVIVSGKMTKDGRPILFKNRDTSRTNNVAVLVQGERYRYIGIVAADDTKPQAAWGGHNETGFAIINTAAYNLNGCEGKDSNGDGEFIRRALEICSSLEDFEHLLDTLPKPMDINSNFGVMDAKGGCAYYETGCNSYVKFDVNDPSVAPDGYLMRTNHGMTGCRSIDIGVERYMAITDFMADTYKAGKIDMEHILTVVPRYLTHGLTKINLYDIMPKNYDDTKMFAFRDYITRWSTASAILIQGVKTGESPLMTVSWTNIGWPAASVAIPLLITPSGVMPTIVGHGADGSSWLCQKAFAQKEKVFNAASGNVHDYIDISKLINQAGTGILQRVLPIEEKIIESGKTMIEQMRKGKKADKLAGEYYRWVDAYVQEVYPQ